MRAGFFAIFTACWLTLLSPIAAAEETSEPPLWELAVAGYGVYGPEYPGSSQSSENFLALPFPIYRGTFLRVGEDTEKPIRGRLFESERVRIDLDMNLNFGAKSADVDARIGMPDIEPMIELGPELELRLTSRTKEEGNLYLGLQTHGAASFDGFTPSWRGMTFSPEVRFVRYFARPGQRLKIRLTPTFASSAYAQYFYDVDAAYATAERDAYQSEGGYMGTTIGVSLHQPVTDNFELRIGGRLGVLGGARNEDSPLFTDSRNQSVYVAFLYKFWASKRRSVADKVRSN